MEDDAGVQDGDEALQVDVVDDVVEGAADDGAVVVL